MSDSDSEAGKELDYYSYDGEDEEQPKKGGRPSLSPPSTATTTTTPLPPNPLKEKLQPDKVTSEICQPVPPSPLAPPPPPPPKLTKERREQIIKEFKEGKEDGEYFVKPRKDGKFIVSKRKTFFTPAAKVDTPTHEEILDRFKKEFQNELREHREYLTKKYKKYRERQRKIEFTPWPPENLPPPVFEQDAKPYVKPARPQPAPGKYKRPPLDIRNF